MTTEIGRRVQSFYNQSSFPDYDLDRFNRWEDILLSAYPFAHILDRSIPLDASVIDVGTGSGQLSALLSLRRKCVWGIDFSDGSLGKARALNEKLDLKSWHLRKVDILDKKQIEKIGMRFDYVLCLGVLHHTGNAYQAFQNILTLLKPKGCIVIGLYNRWGRLLLKIRRMLSETLFKDNEKVKDWFLKIQIGDIQDKERARGWWNDQYRHPHETSHSVGEVLRWFKRNHIQYQQSVPSLVPFNQDCLEISGVWNNYKEGYPFLPIRFYKQLKWIWTTHREGGYWITFGKSSR